jgi:uncharacterized protein YndB with AHSA1/START domain
MGDQPAVTEFGDVTKHVTVPVPAAEAFRILIDEVADWLPPGHTFIKEPVLVRIEEGVGGRFFERGADGAESVHGVITEWEPSQRVKMTWRMGPDWQPVLDDEKASFIEFSFHEEGSRRTRVELTHSEFHRHGEAAAAIRAAVDGPSPGETLARYGEVVSKHARDVQ